MATKVNQLKCDKAALQKFGINPNSYLSNYPQPNKVDHKELFLDYCDLVLTVDDPYELALIKFNNLVELAKSPEFIDRMIIADKPDEAILEMYTKYPLYFRRDGFDPVYMTISSEPSDYENYNIISSLFTDTVRAKGRKDSISVYEFYNDPGSKVLILYVAKLRCKKENIDYDKLPYKRKIYEVREAVYHLFGKRYECTSHRVTTPLMIYKYFNAKRVLDTSAGWGDRSIAAMAVGASYTGLDPNPDLHACYAKMKEVFNPLQNVEYIKICAEDYLTDEEYDIMYTSPPYFTMEKYSEDKNQSINRYKTYDDWKENFYFRMLNNSVKHVKDGGHVAVNIINWVNKNPHPKATFVANFPMIDDMIDYMISIGQIFMGFIYYNGGSYKITAVPIAVFKVVH